MSERCDYCGKYGGERIVHDEGPDGLGGRRTLTLYLCRRCVNSRPDWIKAKPVMP